MRAVVGVLCIVLLAAGGACHKNGQDAPRGEGGTRSAEPPAGRQDTLTGGSVTGTVRHIDLEGGFYGIETDEGGKLDPVNLPEEFQKDGLRLRMRVEPVKDRVSLHMWGALVRIVSLERL